ncbi:FAD synthetase 1, chloroplastic-like [Magnolia sinica]|uniref:FAD synthetase 1, chloroplastic-like n=1 Tax=Magnolia sinica TaxID=86752 RepID=UPI0026580E9F|nr:FAD synthetase 1, chloroplastic-like [Magnolia sinica]
MESGCRVSHYWRGYELGLYSKFRIYPYLAPRNYIKRPSRGSREQQLRRTIAAGFPQVSSSHPNAPMVADCFSQQEDDREFQLEGSSPVAGGIVALGKFDALHIGHRELAIQASKAGSPFLLSFVGMAEVLGWESRAPIVAKCDRKRVLSSWAPYCGNVVPLEFEVEFSNVRHLTPRQFVERLSKELKVSGVVAGENYRFGYKASGDAAELVKLCKEYGLGAYIVSSIMDKSQCSSDGRSKSCDLRERGQVSSTRVRHALAEGDMKYVSELLGRSHRVMLTMDGNCFGNINRMSAPKSCLLNQPPKEGVYENCILLVDHVYVGPCKLMIDETDIHVELNGVEGTQAWVPFRDCQLLGIEFSDTGGD